MPKALIATAFILAACNTSESAEPAPATTPESPAAPTNDMPIAQKAAASLTEMALKASEGQMQAITDKVAMDAIAQFEMVKRSGDAMQTCVHAGMVTAAFLQAKNEPKFKEWKAVEKKECVAAGLPAMP